MKLLKYLVFSLLTSSIFSQNGEIIYNIAMRHIKEKSEHHMTKGVKKEFELMTFILQYDTRKSNFDKKKSVKVDELYSGLAKVFSETYDGTWFQKKGIKECFVNRKIIFKL